MKYRARVTALVEIEAENVVEATRLASKLRVIGSRVGVRRPGPHDRDLVSYTVAVKDSKVGVWRDRIVDA